MTVHRIHLSVVDPCGQSARFVGRVSPGTFSEMFSGRPCDPRAFQRVFPHRWQTFLKTHFRNSVEVAAFFDVDERTARLWLEGVSAPRGWAVSYACTSIPSAAGYLLAAA